MTDSQATRCVCRIMVPIIAICALLPAGGSALGQTGPCALDLQVTVGGQMAARGIEGLVDPELRVKIGPAGSYVVLESSWSYGQMSLMAVDQAASFSALSPSTN